MAVSRRLTLYLSPRKMLSWPTARSKRLRGAIRGGLWSSFSVPGAGIETNVEPYCDGAQLVKGDVNVGNTLPQCRPACICWSAVRTVKSTGVVVSVANGTARRDVLKVHPRSDPGRPLAGVFTTRSPDRPNPLGLHRVVVRKIVKNRLRIGPIEVIDGTPVADIKPILCDVRDS